LYDGFAPVPRIEVDGADRGITPEAFPVLSLVLPLSLQVSPTVIWFILEHIGNLTFPFVGQVQRWRLLALGQLT
jgi:hypothetical protein